MRFTIADHYYLRQALAIEHFDLIISDNRFGCFSRDVRSLYITHQLYPVLPKRLRLLQPIARAVHACIYKRYAEVWVPDYADPSHNLSGLLHGRGRRGVARALSARIFAALHAARNFRKA